MKNGIYSEGIYETRSDSVAGGQRGYNGYCDGKSGGAMKLQWLVDFKINEVEGYVYNRSGVG
jgi:hypothetical protein